MAESKQIRILYMEDDAGLARLVQKRLGRAGYVVDVARDGEEGLAMYATGSYDVVAMDQAMPVHDGLEVIRFLASQAPLPPTIMVTGAGDEKSAVEAMKLGVRDYVVKDVDGGYLELLPSVIERALYQQRLVEENQRAEEELRESEARYRGLFDGVPVGLYRTTPEGQFLDANPTFVEMLGYPDQETLLAANAADFYVDAKDRQRWQAPIERDGVVSDFEVQWRRRDGSVIWVQNTARAARDADGRVLHYEGSLEDITERKRAEEALKRRMAQLASLNQASQAVTASLDPDQVLAEIVSLAGEVAASDYANVVLVDEEGRLGQSAEDLEGLPVIDGHIRTKGFTDWIVRSRQAIVVDDIDEDGTVNPKPANGQSPELVEGAPCTANPLVVGAGVKSFVGLPLLAKDRLLGVLYLHSLRPGNFRAQLPLLTTFANQAAVAIENARLHQEVQHRVEELTFLNRVGRAMTSSLDLEQVLTTVMEETALVLRTEAGSIALLDEESGELVFEAAVGPRSEGVKGLRLPLEQGMAGWVARQGQRLLVPDVAEDPRFYSGIDEATGFVTRSVLAVPLKVKGKVIGVIEAVNKTEGHFVQADVALLSSMAQSAAIAIEKARLYKDLQERMEELKRTQAQLLQVQKMESIGQLAAGIAHDFNNLLTPIGGFAELLLWKAPEGSQQYEYLRQIKIAAERAAALTLQLRLFTRQEEGERRTVQLNSVVKETHDLLERSIPKEITIELRLASELWAVKADPSQISQVLLNLCVNARDAMLDGGALTLETRNVTLDEEQAQAILEARPGRYVCLSVSDTGCGMSSEVQDRLFEPFFTTKEVGKGTGLGLSVVYGIVKRHGGFINVYSQEGRGSTFHVYLPAIESVLKEREVEGLELPTGTESILLVDDEETVRELGQRVLELCGYTVLMAENGLQALEVYQAHRGQIALVVLDVIMPQMGGRECLRRLRELDPQVKVLISTGYTTDDRAQELVAEGALGGVEKPFRLKDFAVAVRAALDKS